MKFAARISFQSLEGRLRDNCAIALLNMVAANSGEFFIRRALICGEVNRDTPGSLDISLYLW
jgi:hypothetical protein